MLLYIGTSVLAYYIQLISITTQQPKNPNQKLSFVSLTRIKEYDGLEAGEL